MSRYRPHTTTTDVTLNMRPSGPSLDTGDLRTDPASDPSDTNIYSRTDWVWDSPLWGDKYVTSYYWDVEYF